MNSITGFIVLLFEFVTRSKSIKSELLCLRVPLNRMFSQDDCGDALPRAALYWMRMLLHHETRLNDFFASALMQLNVYVRSIG